MQSIMKIFITLGLGFIFIGYGVDKIMQTYTGVTFISDSIDNDLLAARTGITVIEYEDHILVKQSNGYIRFIVVMKTINDAFGGFIGEILEVDYNDAGMWDIIKMIFGNIIIPLVILFIIMRILKSVGTTIFPNWYVAAAAFSLLILFLTVYKPFVDGIATIRMVVTYNSEASDTTFELFGNALHHQEEQKKAADSILTEFLTSDKSKNEIVVKLGDTFKPIEDNDKAIPPDLVHIISSQKYLSGNKEEKKELQGQQISENAEHIRRLLFFIYTQLDLGAGKSNEEFSDYSEELVRIHQWSQ